MSADLSFEILKNGIVSPTQSRLQEKNIMHLGVFNAEGRVLESTTDDRHHGSHLYRPADLTLYPAIDDAPEQRAIYAGVYFPHFGHFLLESLARLWYAKDHPEIPVIWIGRDDRSEPPELRGWQHEILALLGIRNQTRVLIRPQRFSELHVPDAGYKYADYCHPQQAEFLACHDGPSQIDGRKLWLSRSGATNNVGLKNSQMVERHLEQAGWIVQRPENFTIRQQLDALSEAEIIAGEEGSAFHTLLLLKDISRKKFEIFRRRGSEHKSFKTIGDARDVNQSFHSTRNDAVISATGRAVRRLAPNADQIFTALDIAVARPVATPPDKVTLDRLSQLIPLLSATAYLEIGSPSAALAQAIPLQNKILVSEEFQFDARFYASKTLRLCEVSLPDFLLYFYKGQKKDLLFFGGNRNFDDLLRDFCTSLPVVHPGSVWLVDHNDMPDAARKFIEFVHDHFLNLTYRTFDSDARRQTIIWQQMRQPTEKVGVEARQANFNPELHDQPVDMLQPGSDAEIYAQLRDWRETLATG